MKGLKKHDDRNEPGPLEVAFMVFSALIVAALFGFTIYQAVTAPEEPTIAVEVTQVMSTADGVEVSIELHNHGSTGWRSVTVEVACDDPAPQATLEQIPPGSTRTAMVACPPGTQDPQASVATRVPA